MRIAVALLFVVACAPVTPAAPTAAPPTQAPAATTAPQPTQAPAAQGQTQVQLALGFVPSVQSAPYYLAEDRGYYAAEGLQVEVKYGTIQNLLNLVSNGDITFAAASGDSLMPQRQQGVTLPMC